MDWIEAIILGLIQGLTEFLPVSSSGHLELAIRGYAIEVETGKWRAVGGIALCQNRPFFLPGDNKCPIGTHGDRGSGYQEVPFADVDLELARRALAVRVHARLGNPI